MPTLNPLRKHNRQSFFKYTTSGTARLILEHSKLRWSAPSQFNDVFDVPRTICDGLDDHTLRHALIDRMNQLVNEPTEPHPQHSNMIRSLLVAVRGTNEATKRKLIAGNEEFRGDDTLISGALASLRELWARTYDEQRILCLTEQWGSASMWDRYSDGHRGTVLEFACLDDWDSAWLMAQPIRYTNDPLQLNTPAGFAELMMYNPAYAVSRLMYEYTHTKTEDWSPEREWRVASWKREGETGAVSDYEFLPIELKSLTLGMRISAEDQGAIQAALRRRYPHAEVWQASIDAGRHVRRIRIV